MNTSSYLEEEKKIAREEALTYAVELLTSNRANLPIAKNDYVDFAHNYVLRNYGDQNLSRYACEEEDRATWKELQSSIVGHKKSSELKVAYLAGPNPLNDFDFLCSLGVNPHNIWAFEANKNVFVDAQDVLSKSSYPFLKLHNWKMDSFFELMPQVFDIIYIDACGPLPSTEQKTLRLLANLFRYGRLAPLGVLITNFAKPDISVAKARKEYSQLISRYLYHKDFLEFISLDLHDDDCDFTEGPEAHGIFEGGFRKYVLENFDEYYSQFITRLIIDLGAAYSPITSLANSRMWDFFINQNAKFLSDLAIEEYIKDPYPREVGDLPYSLHSINNIVNKNSLAKVFKNELGGSPIRPCSVLDAITAFYYVKIKPFEYTHFELESDHNFVTSDFSLILDMLSQHGKYPFFCDVPTEELIYYPIMAQYMYPYHANIEMTKRFVYTASGKSTKMFLDVIPFDACRYIYDLLPTLPIAKNTLKDMSHHLVFRYALDALAKHLRFYNSDLIFGANVVPVMGGEEEIIKTLSPRKEIGG